MEYSLDCNLNTFYININT